MSGRRLVVLSELYPPAVGGSAVLFGEIYPRLHLPVTVLTDERTSSPEAGARAPAAGSPDGMSGTNASRVTVVRRAIATRRWGVADPRGLAHHFRVGALSRRLAGGRGGFVHCGRALPEGVAAWLARRFLWGPRYTVWTHGEDIASALTSRELTWVMRRVYANAATVIANSRNTLGMLEGIGVPARRVAVVYPCVDPQRFRPEVDGRALRARLAPDGGPVLLTVGRLQRRKGHDVTIAAVAQLQERFPGIRYVIAGDGEERARLERLAREHGVAERVVFEGVVGAKALASYYAACDVFVLPNRNEGGDIEGFGIVFLEAAATERPTIGGRSGGVPEALEDGVTGILVGGEDPGELARTIATLLDDGLLRRALGKEGRARVLRSFTWEHAAEAIGALHERLCAEAAGLGRPVRR